MGHREQFHCSTCQKVFERNRDPIVGVTGGVVTEPSKKQDEIKEYYCPEHESMHVISEPMDEIEEIPEDSLSYDNKHMECECGEFHSVYKLELGSCFECECGRIFELTLKEQDE